MDSIVVGFSRPKAWFEPFSWLIRIAEGNPIKWCPYSHAYIRYYNSYADRWEIFQASGMKVNLIGSTMFDAAENIYAEFEVPITAATKQLVVQGAVDKVGSPYGVGQIFGFGWVMFMRLFGKSVKNPFYSASSFVCSELTADILNEINGTTLDSSTMSPKDVCEYMLAKGYKTTTQG